LDDDGRFHFPAEQKPNLWADQLRPGTGNPTRTRRGPVWGAAIGLMPVPGPFDELVLLLVAAVLWLFYRNRLAEAWKRAGTANA
jgi:hypothetical protein